MDQRKQELWATSKCHPQMLIGGCFIPDGKNDGNAKDGLEEGHQVGTPSERQPPLQEELAK